MRVGIIDAGGANIGSVRYALERLGVEAMVSADPNVLLACERLILPGVGAAGIAMERLRQAQLIDFICGSRQPLLGICLGMQLLFEHSEEGDVACLGLVTGRVTRMPASAEIRIPHMGWNQLHLRRPSLLLNGLSEGDHAYFVHSFAAPVTADCIASSVHGAEFAAIVQRGRVAGAQFHPERSSSTGAKVLENFLKYDPPKILQAENP